MNKQEIAATLRNEVAELDATVKKLQTRSDRLKAFVLDLEAEMAGPTPPAAPPGKFRKAIDRVFGEKPKRPKR
jgi:hypothetical protein